MTDHDERLAKLEGRQAHLESENRSITTELSRQGSVQSQQGQDIARALDQSAEALKTTQSSHRILTEHVDHAVGALRSSIDAHLRQQDEHLKQQDEHAKEQDASIGSLKEPIAVLHQAELERAAKAKAEGELAVEQEALAKRRRTRRNDILKNIGILVAIIGGLSGFFGAWRTFAVWALHVLHLSAH